MAAGPPSGFAMYQPPLYEETRVEELHRLIREHPLGILVANLPGRLEAQHIPFVLEAEQGAQGVLIAHVARANPVWEQLVEGASVLVVFRGAHGYISPNWYLSKHEHHQHVPTWNYEIVHVHGRVRVLDDEKFVRGMVAKLTRQQEAPLPEPWKMSDAPADYLAEQLAHIVGLEVEITRIDGKRKLSQNRELRDFDSTVAALQARGQVELANAMLRVRGDGGA
jgi:transcriptional regulator